MGEKANLIESPVVSPGLLARAETAVVGTAQAVTGATAAGLTGALTEEVSQAVRDRRAKDKARAGTEGDMTSDGQASSEEGR